MALKKFPSFPPGAQAGEQEVLDGARHGGRQRPLPAEHDVQQSPGGGGRPVQVSRQRKNILICKNILIPKTIKIIRLQANQLPGRGSRVSGTEAPLLPHSHGLPHQRLLPEERSGQGIVALPHCQAIQ